MERPWQLDPIPLLIPAAEWETMEAGLIQRARLLERRPEPTFTARRTCSSRAAAAGAAVLRPGLSARRATAPCRPAGVYLHLYAADLGRAPDGTLVGAGRPDAGA